MSRTSETNDPEINVTWYSETMSRLIRIIIIMAFETAFADAQVFMNDDLIYSTKDDSDTDVSAFFNFDVPSPKLHIAEIERISDGDVIRINVQSYYNDGIDGIDCLMLGEANDITVTLMKNDSFGFFLCAMHFYIEIIGYIQFALILIMLIFDFVKKSNEGIRL